MGTKNTLFVLNTCLDELISLKPKDLRQLKTKLRKLTSKVPADMQDSTYHFYKAILGLIGEISHKRLFEAANDAHKELS